VRETAPRPIGLVTKTLEPSAPSPGGNVRTAVGVMLTLVFFGGAVYGLNRLFGPK